MNAIWKCLAFSLTLAHIPAGIHAQTWPDKAIRTVVPVGAGSSTDIVSRIVLEQLAVQLGQPIVVENRTGAGGTIGSAHVARSDPGGYVILAHGSAHTIAGSLYSKLAYDPARDLTAAVPLGTYSSVLVVAPGRGLKSAADLVAAARARPGTITFSSVGIGTATHLSAERFRLSAGIQVIHVPYKGGSEAMNEVIAGRVDFFFGPTALVLPNIRDGRLAALAVNGSTRSPLLRDVPTLSEAGFSDAEYPIWFGLFVPAKTPVEVVEKLHGETMKALHTPKLRDRLTALGVDPMPLTPREFEAHVSREIASNAALVRTLGIRPE